MTRPIGLVPAVRLLPLRHRRGGMPGTGLSRPSANGRPHLVATGSFMAVEFDWPLTSTSITDVIGLDRYQSPADAASQRFRSIRQQPPCEAVGRTRQSGSARVGFSPVSPRNATVVDPAGLRSS